MGSKQGESLSGAVGEGEKVGHAVQVGASRGITKYSRRIFDDVQCCCCPPHPSYVLDWVRIASDCKGCVYLHNIRLSVSGLDVLSPIGGEGRCSVTDGFNAGDRVVFFLVKLEEITNFISNKLNGIC